MAEIGQIPFVDILLDRPSVLVDCRALKTMPLPAMSSLEVIRHGAVFQLRTCSPSDSTEPRAS